MQILPIQCLILVDPPTKKRKKKKKKKKEIHIYLPNTYRLGLGALCNICNY